MNFKHLKIFKHQTTEIKSIESRIYREVYNENGIREIEEEDPPLNVIQSGRW